MKEQAMQLKHRRQKSDWLKSVVLTIGMGIWLLASTVSPALADPATLEQPNFVVILIDDLGWTDLGCYGSQYYETPNIDRLAAKGVRFTNGYAACSVCSPSRAALLTGNYPARIGITDWIRFRRKGKPPAGFESTAEYESVGGRLETPRNLFWLEHRHETIAEILGDAGYTSAHIGKWHLGPEDYYPERQGFDVNIAGCDYGMPATYFFPYETKWQSRIYRLDGGKPGEYLTDRLANEAGKFIEEHRDQRFFLHYAPYSVHTPIEAKEELLAKYEAKPKAGQKNAAYAGMVESVDDAVGTVLAKLEEMELSEKTVVIFTSDNGGYLNFTNNAPLRGGKGMVYEGGLRVPFIVHWPGVTEVGAVKDTPVMGIDVLPTLLDIAGIEPNEEKPVDGVSLVPLLADEGELERTGIYWHFPHYRGSDANPYGIVRAGDYKLIRQYEDGSTELYNLREDLSEEQDLVDTMPEKAKELDLMLSKWLIGTGAKLPRPDPKHKEKTKTSSAAKSSNAAQP